MRTADDVANMETELRKLRAQCEEQKNEIIRLGAELRVTRSMNVTLQRRAEDHLSKASRIESIMSQVSAGLIAGLNELYAERMAKDDAQSKGANVVDSDEPFRPNRMVAGVRTGRLDPYAPHPKDRGLDVGTIAGRNDATNLPGNEWPQTDAPATPHIMTEAGR